MINYKHLYYFYVVAQKGGITQASETLHVTPQTISGQLSVLEERLGVTLFVKSGRNLKVSEQGKLVMEYATKIFSLGGELEDLLRQSPDEQSIDFRVGVLDVVPKSIAYQLLSPAVKDCQNVRIFCREGNIEELLLDLAVHKLDMVISDIPIPKQLHVKGFNHHLGQSGISFFAAKALLPTLTDAFPKNLDQAPFLIQGKSASLHSKITSWFEAMAIRPKIVGEFDDTALMKAFGSAGTGVFAVPSSIAKEIEHEYDVVEIGRTEEVVENFYAITVQRKIIHPAVISVTEAAKSLLV